MDWLAGNRQTVKSNQIHDEGSGSTKAKKALVIFGIIYLFLPVDLIPPVLFPIAWVDDFILWLWILWHLKDILDTYWLGEKEVDLSKIYWKNSYR